MNNSLKLLAEVYSQILQEHADDVNDVSKVNPNPEAREDTSALEEKRKKPAALPYRYYFCMSYNGVPVIVDTQAKPEKGMYGADVDPTKYDEFIALDKPYSIVAWKDDGCWLFVNGNTFEELDKNWREEWKEICGYGDDPEGDETIIDELSQGLYNWLAYHDTPDGDSTEGYVLVINGEPVDATSVLLQQRKIERQKSEILSKDLGGLDIDV